MKRLLYASIFAHVCLVGLVSAMELQKSTKKIESDRIESDNMVTFNSYESIHFDTRTNQIKIPITSKTQNNSHYKQYIVCHASNMKVVFSDKHATLKDQNNIPWKLGFSSVNEILDFQTNYQKIGLQAKANIITSHIEKIFPACDEFTYNSSSFDIKSMLFFQTESLWKDASVDDVLFYKDVAKSFASAYINTLTPLLLVTGYKVASREIYRLAIPLKLLIKGNILHYEDYEDLSCEYGNRSQCTIMISEGNKQFQTAIPFCCSIAKRDDIDAKKFGQGNRLDGNNTDLTNLIASYAEKRMVPSFYITMLGQQQNQLQKSNSTEEKKREDSASSSTSMGNLLWNIGKKASYVTKYSAEALPIVMGGAHLLLGSGISWYFVAKNVHDLPEHVRYLIKYSYSAILLALVLGPDIRRYSEKIFQKDTSEPITLKNEARHAAARIVSVYLCYKLLSSKFDLSSIFR